MNRKKIKCPYLILFAASLILTFVILRISLTLFPHLNFNLGSYNIHHIYLGAVLLILSTIFLLAGRINNSLVIGVGIACALILDELVFLIATDGGDLTYLGSVSFFGGLISVIVIVLITIGIYFIQRRI